MPRETLVLKLGGELLEGDQRLDAAARAIAGLAARRPLVVVHGGGREIDAELALRQIPRRAADGLRITDEATLEVVVAVLAGTLNTRLVAALVAGGGQAVGLTGADAALCPVAPAPRHRATDGREVDLGRVGEPAAGERPALLEYLLAGGYVPVVACLGIARDGRLFNVNADTMAADLAVRLGADRLLLAGGTAGVLDAHGRTIPELDEDGMAALVESGTASAGMVAKLAACRRALDGGVGEIAIVDGRELQDAERAPGTRIVRAAIRRSGRRG